MEKSTIVDEMKSTYFFVFCFSAIYVIFAITQFGDSLIPSSGPVEVSFEPKTINLRSKGQLIICHLSVLSEEYTVEDVNVSSIMLMDSLMVSHGEVRGRRLKLTFSRTQVIDLLNEMFSPPQYIRFKYVDFRVTGSFFDGTTFSSFEQIKVVFG